MSLLRRLFRPVIELAPALARRAAAWRALPSLNDATTLAQARLVVVDVETTGLDPRRDRLLAIGACAVEGGRLHTGAGYEALLRQAIVGARENILIHGIGPQEQATGAAPEEALMGFLEFARKDLLVAFHAPFDQAVLDRAARAALGLRLLNPFIDLADLAPALCPEARLPHAGLDDWLAYFGLRAAQRHRAAHDAIATGELLLILLHRARMRGVVSVSALRALVERRASAGAGMGGA